MNVFEEMPEPIRKAVARAGFSEPTPIQEEAIPLVAAGRDLFGIAQTGTGKTAAFVLPILKRMFLDPRKGIRTLILCPTRELAAQVDASIELFTKRTRITHTVIFGGVGQGPQVSALKRGVDILVATPGRLFDLHEQGYIKLGKVEFFVLDEADRMLDMGFINDIRKIAKLLPKNRQTLFFSATMGEQVTRLAHTLLNDPERIEITPQATPVEKIEQHVLFVDHEQKTELLIHLLNQEHLEKVLIFARTKRGADRLCRILKKNKVSAAQIHGDRTQNQRTNALKAFTNGKARCLVATDVAARGIDIDDISHVINYDLPREAENYVHRIGRTARAGAKGVSYSFCTADEMPLLREIQKLIGMVPVKMHKFHSDAAQKSTVKKVPVRKPPVRGRGGAGRGGTPRKGKKPSFRKTGGRRHGGSKRRKKPMTKGFAFRQRGKKD